MTTPANEPPLKLLLVASNYPPLGNAGLERVSQRLARELGARGHQVTILTQCGPQTERIEREAPGVTVYRVLAPWALGPLWGASYMFQVRRWMKQLRDDWDLVLTQQLYLHTAVAAPLARALGKRSAVRMVNTGEYSDIAVLLGHRGGGRLLKQALESDAFFYLSKAGRNELIRASIPEAAIWPFFNPVDTDQFSPGGEPEHGRFLFLGRFDKQKNIEGLLRAFELFAGRNPNATIRLVGKGLQDSPIAAMRERSEHKERIVICEWSDDPAGEYRKAWAVVSASISEGLSNVMLEAMSCGTPVIVTDVSGARDVLDPQERINSLARGEFAHGEGGLLVNVQDDAAMASAMETMLDQELRCQLSTQARHRIETDFATSRATDHFVNCARAIISGKSATEFFASMKIALLANAASRHTQRWAQWLTRFGHEVVVFSDDAPRPDMCYDKVRVMRPDWTLWRRIVVFGFRRGKYANNKHKWKAYKEKIHAVKPDLLHAMEATAYGPMLAHFPGFPRVLTPWGSDIECLRGDDQQRRRLSLQSLVAADYVVTNAKGLEEDWANLTGEAREKFRLYPWGIEQKTFQPRSITEENAIVEKLALPTNTHFVLSPRLANPNYGIELMLRGWTRAQNEEAMAPCHFVVLRAGAADDVWKRWQRLANELRAERVCMIDQFLNEQEMAALYSASQATIMIPERDLLAMSLIESTACGSFPILADNVCYRAAFDDAETFLDTGRQRNVEGIRKGAAIFLQGRDEAGVSEALLRWAKLFIGDRQQIAAHNQSIVESYYTWENSARHMDRVYQLAREKFDERQKGGARKR